MGPLHGVKVIEIASIGPGPFAAMLLADLGADVVRIDRAGGAGNPLGEGAWNFMHRGRRSAAVDLKHADGRELILRLCERTDALIEGFRPGVMERLGLGPDTVAARNPRLVYGRMTGYGQDGPMAHVAGHDINYIAIAGVLGAMGRTGERPPIPLNLVADFGGGGMLLALGVVSAVLEARTSGQGQVVDAAMVEGSALLATMFHAMRAAGLWSDTPGTNLLDSGAPFYEVYATSDGGHVAVGALEPQFYATLLRLLELEDMPQWERARWPEYKQRFAAVFATRTRDEWAARLEGEDACATAVLALHEAPHHPHNVARGTFTDFGPAPAPRFSRTPAAISRPPAEPGADTDAVLADWGIEDVAALRAAGAVSGPG
ncbi:CoA transferase [Solirubrobacter sp. CPCC 204708]|uniref:CoA transferase n=1 Tax=Solirubrobacter deserti TaxID=2282478 RepID=A0ABT4RE61_9ACTN|nr:CaiB/BaiF CoA-transferase family protein [Solirubrobacter deserti]MBE2316076.1 CoA transferase [Solirubrobacter deserti]MDA0136826.1 CoA transferase [Solirubrobacter deserti]